MVLLFFHSDVTNNTNFSDINLERIPAKICKLCGNISTSRPVFISYIKKSYIVDKLEDMLFVVSYYTDIENLCSNSYFAVITKDKLAE